ncbi:MAG: arginine--tRNA ligase [Actinomycetota bacterium]|nr:arginine--tRNA ligase [Actinomycetota bacterium]
MAASMHELRAAVQEVATAIKGGDGEPPAQTKVERPKRQQQGDYSTNVAMLLAPSLGAPPRDIAERVGVALAEALADELSSWEIAGPGFLNLTLSDAWYRAATRSVLDAGDRYGAGGAAVPEQLLLEFLSANPTGPLVAANGQSAAYGDALARILSHHGHTVATEYYFNDAGGQIRRLGESVLARATGTPIPEGGYQGEYVHDLAAEIPEVRSLSADEAAAAAVEILLSQVKATLHRYGVHYDRFFSERTLHQGAPSFIERSLALAEQAGHTYRSEGALWLRTTSFGDDKDRVLERSDGAPTYLAADLGYLLEKLERGVERQIIPAGADHHGYVARMKAAFATLGGEPDRLEMPILQFVHLIEGTERAAMSKRRGDFVTLDELLDEIGVDATRYFMLQRSHDRTLDLDLGLAKRQDRDNPVYYIQYAHARIVTMLGKLDAERADAALAAGADWGDGVLEPAERALIKSLAQFPDEVAEAADRRGPHRIAAYALELAQDFTAFYRDCKVVGAQPPSTESFRVALAQSARQTIALALGLLGVSAPDSM